jgi:hypothetical protein
MNLDDMTPETIKAIYDMGGAVAAAYRVGDVFLGAFGEAEAYGFAVGSWQCDIFTTGFLRELKQPIMTMRNSNVLVQYGEEKSK